MLGDFNVQTFRPHLGEAFRIEVGDGSQLEAILTEATALGEGMPQRDRRAPFSIVLRGPQHPVLSQRTYPVEHAEIGKFELFLVPIGPDLTGMRYEAIFG
jgi:hypothetical protein